MKTNKENEAILDAASVCVDFNYRQISFYKPYQRMWMEPFISSIKSVLSRDVSLNKTSPADIED